MTNKIVPILRLALTQEQSVVDARQRSRLISQALGFDSQDQTRIATAISEVARNAFRYARNGRVDFSVDLNKPAKLLVRVSDDGPGIEDVEKVLSGRFTSTTGMGIGLAGTRKLMDHFSLDSSPKAGTVVQLAKYVPFQTELSTKDIVKLCDQLARIKPESPMEEVQRQNAELLHALDELQSRQEELSRLNEELADTNRGVVALYAELDEKAVSLQRANEVKSGFLSHMTHEFRTPLTSIISLTRILIDKIDGDLTPEQERQVRYIRQSSEGLLELVNDLLDLAKVEAGKVTVKQGETDSLQILGALRAVFKPLVAQDSDVELLVDMNQDPIPLVSDEAKIAQILRNLISNALKFTEEGTVSVTCEVRGENIVFVVKDTGIGIPDDFQQRIFEDFSQIDSKLQSKSKGTGLGLPLSRKLARILGGDLTVKSKVAQGTEFELTLPRNFVGDTEGVLVEPSALPQERPLSEPLALLIDDDEASRYVVRNLAGRLLPMRYLEAADVETARRFLLRETPDVIFLDLHMPGTSGFEFIRELKSHQEWQGIPVIINTARILSPDDRDMLDQLSTSILSKERSNNERAMLDLSTALTQAGIIPETSEAAL